tara:strand:+ start:365 stop:640 length:276 start_codon:yes stop_codon:yes gene_type:complete
MNPILKAIINLIKSIISKFAYNKKINKIVEKQKVLKEEIKEVKQRKKVVKNKIKNSNQKLKNIRNAKKTRTSVKDTEDYVKKFIKKGNRRK